MKKIIIMGASSGIGYALAEALASRRVRVGLAARTTEPLRRLKDAYPDYVEYMAIDVTEAKAPEHLKLLIERLGGMDIYVHVAGIGYSNEDLTPAREVEMLQTNVVGFARMVSSAYRYFRDNGVPGQIAALTSVAGTNGIGRMAAYSASKRFDQTYLTALEQLARAERVKVDFTDIRPGWVRTPLLNDDKEYPMEMTVAHVLPLIIRAIVRRERVVVIDWRWNILVGLWRMIPNALWTRMEYR